MTKLPQKRSAKQIVPENKRQRVPFACDRCIRRKQRCERTAEKDPATAKLPPCLSCRRDRVDCTTTAQRKRRVIDRPDDVGGHYRSLLALVKGLFPDANIQDITQLNEIGKALDIEMPVNSRSNEDEKTVPQGLPNNLISKLDISVPMLTPSDRLITDNYGRTHFIGKHGTANMLRGLRDLIMKKSINPTPVVIYDKMAQTITSEYNPKYQYPISFYNDKTIMNVNHFPLIDVENSMVREEADYYVRSYFKNLAPFYFLFNEMKFMETYNQFWVELENAKSDPIYKPKLSHARICCVYLIWILGSRYQQYETNSQYHLLDETINKFVDIIRLCLPDVVLKPSVDGIRILMLFAVYLSSIKVRESGFSLIELACIQAKALGLHKKAIIDKFQLPVRDVMKRVMWSLAKTESFLCCSFGRSSSIQWDEIDIDLPLMADILSEDQRIFFNHSIKLTKIIFKILDYKRWSQNEPLSLRSLERALYLKGLLEKFHNELPPDWQDPKTSNERFKSRIHTHYNYFFITLTLPMFLFTLHSPTYIIKNDDPFLSLVICAINASFATADIIGFQDENGLFNGTISYDCFNSYNAIMLLLLTYILIKTSRDDTKPKIDLKNLNDVYQINIDKVLKSINIIRDALLNNVDRIDGTMKKLSDVCENLLHDLGLIPILMEKFGARDSTINDPPRMIKTKFLDYSNQSNKTDIPTTSNSTFPHTSNTVMPNSSYIDTPEIDLDLLTDQMNKTIANDDISFNAMLNSLGMDPGLIDSFLDNMF